MNILKRILAAAIGACFLFSLAACSDTSWSVKTDNDALSPGVYIYYMSTAYSEAYTKVEDNTSDILNQQVEGQDASEWIKDHAMLSCKKLLEVEKRYADLGLTMTDEETATADATTKAQWNQYGKLYEGFGIAKDSFHRASTLYDIKYSKVFEATYGKDGAKAVSDEDLQNYYTSSYTDYSYFAKSLSKTDEEGNSEAMSDEEIEAVKNQFEGYQQEIENGSSFADVAKQYQQDDALQNDPTVSDSSNLEKDSSLPDEIINTLKELQPGSSSALKANNKYYLLIKNDITQSVDTLQTDSVRNDVLSSMKSDEFSTDIEESAKQLEVQINQAVVKKYQPSIFTKATSSKSSKK